MAFLSSLLLAANPSAAIDPAITQLIGDVIAPIGGTGVLGAAVVLLFKGVIRSESSVKETNALYDKQIIDLNAKLTASEAAREKDVDEWRQAYLSERDNRQKLQVEHDDFMKQYGITTTHALSEIQQRAHQAAQQAVTQPQASPPAQSGGTT